MRFTEIRIAVTALVLGATIGWSLSGHASQEARRATEPGIDTLTTRLVVSVPENDRRHSYILNVVRTGTSHNSDDPDPKNWRIVFNGERGPTFLEAEVVAQHD